MLGGHGSVNISPEDKKNILNAEISELERRKGILSKEIEDHYRIYKNRLDLEYNTRLKKIEEGNIQRQREIDRQEDNLKQRAAFLENQISSGAAEIKAKIDLADAKIKDADDATNRYAKLSEDIKAEYGIKLSLLKEEQAKTLQEREDLAKEKLIVKDIQEKVATLEKQNQETQRRLEAALKDVESRQAFLVYWEGEIKKKDDQNAVIKEELAKQKLEQDNREVRVASKEEEADRLLGQAQALLKENQEKQALLDKQLLEVKEQGKSLTSWRDELNELQLSLNEQERYYLIREREIDKKIKILQKLREEGGK